MLSIFIHAGDPGKDRKGMRIWGLHPAQSHRRNSILDESLYLHGNRHEDTDFSRNLILKLKGKLKFPESFWGLL